MAMIKFEPFKDLTSIREHLNRMLEESIIKMVQCKSSIHGTWNPPVDIYELEKEIIFTVELPGIDQDGITLEMKNEVLTLKGERKLRNDVKETDYTLTERLFGTFERSFSINAHVDVDSIKATCKDGVLTVILPKIKEKSKRKIRVDAN